MKIFKLWVAKAGKPPKIQIWIQNGCHLQALENDENLRGVYQGEAFCIA